jgi:hypothetical protein
MDWAVQTEITPAYQTGPCATEQNGLFVSESGEPVGDQGELHTDELHTVHCSPKCIKVTESLRMGWATY